MSPALEHWVVSRFDAPFDSGLRDRSLLDPGNALFLRLGIAPGTLVLIRPDEYIAAIVPMNNSTSAQALYEAITGLPPPTPKAATP
jgi:3-(3-hydroxy-phenyl)propionate hydroxylase